MGLCTPRPRHHACLFGTVLGYSGGVLGARLDIPGTSNCYACVRWFSIETSISYGWFARTTYPRLCFREAITRIAWTPLIGTGGSRQSPVPDCFSEQL